MQKELHLLTLMPDMAILANRTVVMPPRTGEGMLVKNAPTLPKIPNNSSQQAHPKPASLEATLVRDTTPLFWEKVVFGIVKAKAANREFTESPSSPPCALQGRPKVSCQNQTWQLRQGDTFGQCNPGLSQTSIT